MREIRWIEFDSNFEHRIQPEICFEFGIFGSARHFQFRKVRRNQVQYKCWRTLNTPCHNKERYREKTLFQKSFRDTEREWRKRQKEEQESDKRECDWEERKERMRLRRTKNWARMNDRVKEKRLQFNWHRKFDSCAIFKNKNQYSFNEFRTNIAHTFSKYINVIVLGVFSLHVTNFLKFSSLNSHYAKIEWKVQRRKYEHEWELFPESSHWILPI